MQRLRKIKSADCALFAAFISLWFIPASKAANWAGAQIIPTSLHQIIIGKLSSFAGKPSRNLVRNIPPDYGGAANFARSWKSRAHQVL